jgi:hypothetical protein
MLSCNIFIMPFFFNCRGNQLLVVEMAVDGQRKYISYTNCSNNRQLQKRTSCFSMLFHESEWPWLCVFSFHSLKTIIKPWNSMTLTMCIYFHSLVTLIEPWSLATYHITQKHTHTHNTHTHIHTKWKEVGEEYFMYLVGVSEENIFGSMCGFFLNVSFSCVTLRHCSKILVLQYNLFLLLLLLQIQCS